MLTVYSEKHKLHSPNIEFTQGKVGSYPELPERAQIILKHLKMAQLGNTLEPKSYSKDKILAVHTAPLVNLIENGYRDWMALGRSGPAFPSAWLLENRSEIKTPLHIDGRLGYFCTDTATPLTQTSWEAIQSSVNCALTAADLLNQGQASAFALCRPPGHHAAANSFGGFCFLNNSAIAIEHLKSLGAGKIATLDIDYHHGNGTQDIFYRRSDVLTVSLHADPKQEFPFYWGHADEKGHGDGLGYNLNLPLPYGTKWLEWSEALSSAIKNIEQYRPEILVVGLGVDTYKDDPVSDFLLDSDTYPKIGAKIASLGVPTLFIMEGGYAIEMLGINVTGLLSGFLQRHSLK